MDGKREKSGVTEFSQVTLVDMTRCSQDVKQISVIKTQPNASLWDSNTFLTVSLTLHNVAASTAGSWRSPAVQLLTYS